MDHDTLSGITFFLIVVLFFVTWPYNPLNPTYTHYPGMVVSKDQIMSYVYAIVGISLVIFLWVWFVYDR